MPEADDADNPTRFVDDVVDVILRTRKEDPTHA
jgi:hypothetical protein